MRYVCMNIHAALSGYSREKYTYIIPRRREDESGLGGEGRRQV